MFCIILYMFVYIYLYIWYISLYVFIMFLSFDRYMICKLYTFELYNILDGTRDISKLNHWHAQGISYILISRIAHLYKQKKQASKKTHFPFFCVGRQLKISRKTIHVNPHDGFDKPDVKPWQISYLFCFLNRCETHVWENRQTDWKGIVKYIYIYIYRSVCIYIYISSARWRITHARMHTRPKVGLISLCEAASLCYRPFWT